MVNNMEFELKKSGVILDDEHRYWLGEKELSGITGIIKRLVFGDPYANVPKRVLAVRADFGKVFHEEMELYINTGIEGHSDVFGVFKEYYSDIEFVKSEYIVTDGERYASPIDAIDKDEVIWDFKTSTKKDIPYWEWQMGVYCHLYNMLNGRRPKGSKVLWINKNLEHQVVEINPVSEVRVKALLEAAALGMQFVDPQPAAMALVNDGTGNANIGILSDERLQTIYDIEKMIIRLDNEKKEAEQRKQELCAGLVGIFKDKGVKSLNTDKLVITYKEGYKRKSFDSKTFAAEHPEMYIQYQKESSVKESITIKIK